MNVSMTVEAGAVASLQSHRQRSMMLRNADGGNGFLGLLRHTGSLYVKFLSKSKLQSRPP
eukprot:6213522-Pleurochrysis_carterae.AAC.4